MVIRRAAWGTKEIKGLAQSAVPGMEYIPIPGLQGWVATNFKKKKKKRMRSIMDSKS